MIKSLTASAILCCVLGSVTQAATVQTLDMSQNQWAILEFQNTNSLNLIVNPTSADGSFSFTYAFSQDGCGAGADQYNTWSCMPSGLETNVVNTGLSHNFGEGWFDKVDAGFVQDPFSISYQKDGAENLFMYLRVTSGSGSVSQVVGVNEQPASVPLPAAGLMLLAGIASFGGLGMLKRRGSKSKG